MVRRLLGLSALFSANAQFAQQIGPAINYTIAWSTRDLEIDICVSAISKTFTTESYIAIGFSPAGSHQMKDADIVAGSVSTPPFTLFSNALTGYPQGVSTMQISRASVSLQLPRLTMCFTRQIQSGANALTDQQRVIWAVGRLGPDGKLSYHGSDSEDASGFTQTHRSDDNPLIDFLHQTDSAEASREDGQVGSSAEGDDYARESEEQWANVPLDTNPEPMSQQLPPQLPPPTQQQEQPRQLPTQSQPTQPPAQQPTQQQTQQTTQQQTQQTTPQQTQQQQQPQQPKQQLQQQPQTTQQSQQPQSAQQIQPRIPQQTPQQQQQQAQQQQQLQQQQLQQQRPQPQQPQQQQAVAQVNAPAAVASQVQTPSAASSGAPSPTPKTSATDRTPGDTQPREQRKWSSNTFAETGSPMFQKPTLLASSFGGVVSSPTVFSSFPALSSLPLATAPSALLLATTLPATTLPTTTLPATFGTTVLPATFGTTLPAALPSTSLPASSVAWPSRFGVPSVQATPPTQWSQASNSWVAPLPSGSSSTSTIVSPMDPVSAQYSRPTNQGFTSAEVHTFSDNLQPGYQAKPAASLGSNYWNSAVNPGWGVAQNSNFASFGTAQAPQATVSFAGISAADSTGVTG